MAVALRLASDGDCPVSRAVRYVAVMRSTPLAASRGRNRDRLRRLGRIPRSVPRSEACVFFVRTRPGGRACLRAPGLPAARKISTLCRKEELYDRKTRIKTTKNHRPFARTKRPCRSEKLDMSCRQVKNRQRSSSCRSVDDASYSAKGAGRQAKNILFPAGCDKIMTFRFKKLYKEIRLPYTSFIRSEGTRIVATLTVGVFL